MKRYPALFLKVFLPVLLPAACFSQDAGSDVKRIAERYRHADYVIGQRISYYVSGISAVAYDSAASTIVKYNQSYYQDLFNSEKIVFADHAIEVNHGLRYIEVQPKNNEENPETLGLDLAALVTTSTHTEHEKMSATVSKYTFRFSFGIYESIELFFDPATYAISRYVFYYSKAVSPDGKLRAEKPRVEFVFEPLQGKNAKDFFTEERYISRQGKEILPAAAFKHYQIKNYLNLHN